MLEGQVGLSLGKKNMIENPWDAYFEAWRQNTLTFRPGIGYFVQDGLAFGLTPIFGINWNNPEKEARDPIVSNSFDYGLGLFSRKYIPAGEKISFFGELRAEVAWSNFGTVELSERTISGTSNRFTGYANIGMQYMVSKKLGILMQSPLFTYTSTKSSDGDNHSDYTVKKSNLDARLFSSFYLGATFFFN